MPLLIDILVFKKTLSNRKRINEIVDDLEAHPQILEWNVDLHDHDHIHWVVSGNVVPGEIESCSRMQVFIARNWSD